MTPTRSSRCGRGAGAWLVLALLPAALAADEIHLRGGGRVSGEIVAESETEVKVDIGAGRMTVKRSSIERIEKTRSPLTEYRERAAVLQPNQVEGWRELGRWATRQGLGVQAREAYGRVLAVLPDDGEANEAHGRVFHDGRWMREEDAYRAQGYVLFEDQWILPQERDAILAERQVQEEAEAAEIAEQIRAEEEDRAAREAEDQADYDRFWAGSEIAPGGMVYWDYGVAPGVWPEQPALDTSPP